MFNNRRDVETKQELHQRTDDLRDKLWEISDIRKSEAEAERKVHSVIILIF